MPPVFTDRQMNVSVGQNATTTVAPSAALQVVCAWPVSGQYGPGSRVLYYVLIAACVFARKADWLRNACLAAVLLFPAVAALHGITLAALHVENAVDMDIYGAFQLCSLGILAAPVTARLSRTYFEDPGRNMIFLWTILLLAGLLSLTVEFFRIQTVSCPHDDSGNPISLNVNKFPYNVTCGLVCSTEQGPLSPMRRDAANNIYVIPAPDKLTFNTGTLFAAACCIPAVLSLVSMWNKILEINWTRRFGSNESESVDEQIEGTNGATIGKMNVINGWIRIFLSAVEAPIFGAAVIAILVIGERNFFSPQVRYQTEPIASIGQWAPIVGTGLAVLGSLYVALAKILSRSTEDPASEHSNGGMQGCKGNCVCNVSLHSVVSRTGEDTDNGRRTSNDIVPAVTRPSLSHSTTIDTGNRRKVAKMLTTLANYLGTAGYGQFDDSGFRRGKATDFPEIPGEAHRNRNLTQIRERYNPDRDVDGDLTPVSFGPQSRMGSTHGSIFSDLQMTSPLVRVSSPQRTQSGTSSTGQTLEELPDATASPPEPGKRARSNTLEVPPLTHHSLRTSQERSDISSGNDIAE